MSEMKFKTIEAYISSFPVHVQEILNALRAYIKELVPEATEKISYQMPTFYLNGNLVHFAAYENHIGFYPTPSGMTEFETELSKYKTGKGSAQFPIDQPLPFPLIAKIVMFRVEENTQIQDKKKKKVKAEKQAKQVKKIKKIKKAKTSALGEDIQLLMNLIHSDQNELRNEAYMKLMAITEVNIDWAYEVWDSLLEDLTSKDNHVRSIAAQALCNLTKNDVENRIFIDFKSLIQLTKDERFVTARHCLQSLWKIGIISEAHRDLVVVGLKSRFIDAKEDKNCTLIRADIIQNMKNMKPYFSDDVLKNAVQELIGIEADEKYKIKYMKIWNKKEK